MKLFYNKTTIFLICAITVTGLSLSAKTYTLANGTTINNPYVISKRPNGLEIGHDVGVMFIKFELLPEKIQKQYGYSPEAAKKYEEDKAKKKIAQANQKQAEAKKQEIFTKKMDKQRLVGSIERLKLNIAKAENRVEFLKKEIPRLHNECDKMLSNTTKMASTSVSGNGGSRSSSRSRNSGRNSRSRSSRYGWDGGYTVYSSNSAGRRAESTKRRTISKMEDKYSLSLKNVRKYEKELANKEIEIMKMQNQLKRYKSNQ